MIIGIDVVYVHALDPVMRRWYNEVLGLEQGYGDLSWQEFVTQHPTRFALDFIKEVTREYEKQPLMISFQVDDIYQTVKDLAAKGVAFFPDAETTVYQVGASLVANFQDPDGNWMQLSQSYVE